MHPGAQEIGGIGDPDDPGSGAPEFVDDRVRQRVVTADDDFTMELKGFLILRSSRLGCLLADGVDRDRHNHSDLR
jgi:hypothetical protein